MELMAATPQTPWTWILANRAHIASVACVAAAGVGYLVIPEGQQFHLSGQAAMVLLGLSGLNSAQTSHIAQFVSVLKK
jgi:hypothetical protein